LLTLPRWACPPSSHVTWVETYTLSKCGKVWDTLGKYGKVWNTLGKCGKV